ncbi:pyruvate decarboxylase 2 [Populus alba]|uniref:pyruvate decarboxylase 2 n=1 Tax=Populus alba TaxID=43335 RepID=UPI00158B448A|nr:pyruvate decarboxylase 2-like [Populus alba]
MSQGAQLWLLRQETPGFIARDSSYQKDVCTIQHGSIGWSVGATPGYARSLPYKRVIACIVDGSFQSTIFVINNGGYTIEVEIHDGPYNRIKNWNYSGLVDAIHNGDDNCWTKKELIETATEETRNCLYFIEVIDASKELLEWGVRV